MKCGKETYNIKISAGEDLGIMKWGRGGVSSGVTFKSYIEVTNILARFLSYHGIIN